MFHYSHRSTIGRRWGRSAPTGSAHALPLPFALGNSGASHRTLVAVSNSKTPLTPRLPRRNRLQRLSSRLSASNTHCLLSSCLFQIKIVPVIESGCPTILLFDPF